MRLPLLILLLPMVAVAQESSFNWSAPMDVASGATYGKDWPRIVLTDNDVPVVMWGRSSTDEIFVARYTDSGFSTPVNVVPSGVSAFVADWAGPDVAASGDTVYVTFTSKPATDGHVYVVRSVDGGLTWSDTVRADFIGTDIPRFPAIDVTAAGNPILTYMRFDSLFLEPEYDVIRSIDAGQSFLTSVSTGVFPGEACDCCPTDLSVEGTDVVVPFRNNASNIRDTWLAHSSSAGSVFDTIMLVDTSAWFLTSCPASGPDGAISNDTAIAVWVTAASGPARVWLSATSLITYTTAWQLEIEPILAGNQDDPRITAKGDTIGLVFGAYESANFDCKLAYSTTGPSGLFGTPEVINSPTTGSQQKPDVAFNNGTFHIVYKDLSDNKMVYRTATFKNLSGLQDKLRRTIKVHPNPATDQIEVLLPASELPKSWRIVDMLGRMIQQFEGKATLDVSNIEPGAYLLLSEDGLLAANLLLL